jgi:hypothetical protein
MPLGQRRIARLPTWEDVQYIFHPGRKLEVNWSRDMTVDAVIGISRIVFTDLHYIISQKLDFSVIYNPSSSYTVEIWRSVYNFMRPA